MPVQSRIPGRDANVILPVPYFVQPTGNTCQSTVLKMMATYFDQEVIRENTGSISLNIRDIYNTINTSLSRPEQRPNTTNSHTNIKWWLQKRFPALKFKYLSTSKEDVAIQTIINSICAGFPVFASVTHENNKNGHIILICGFVNYVPTISSIEFKLVVHDPNGSYDPYLDEKFYGDSKKKNAPTKYTGGSTLLDGSENGPGKFRQLPITCVSRRRIGCNRFGMFELMFAYT